MTESMVRRATASDDATIAGLQIQVWQQAFARLLPARVALTDPIAHAAAWDARLRQGGPVLLALEGPEPVGFAAMSTGPDERNLLATIGEIEVLYVVPRWGRRGHGGRLLA
ncbi:MAG TPA: GNAT family N-acetyltransferase, partial [Nakamurella sp.]